ncbi:MAG: type IV toxin-antitoxin system AbiEi family antitoxin domain-containing protein [Actinobacteria bacterium]|nr:type IV toxin-antitoxin system AbiEi family antitoxin domain-containing protein [Actinomycetota bacterium]
MNVQTQLRILAAVDANAGVLTPETAALLGISRTLLTRARNEGILDRPTRGVYVRPGNVVSLAAIDAARIGPPAVLSHRGAASFYGWDGVQPGAIEWSIPHTRHPAIAGVHLRRRFDDLDVVERDGLLVTSPAQTLADLGHVVETDIVERAIESALREGDITDSALRAFAAPASHRPGAPTLRVALNRRPEGAPHTDSDAETLCIQVYRHRGVRDPVRQYEIWDDDVFVAQVDLHWWPIPFGVEVDGLASHATPDALQYDLNRANRIGDAQHLIRRFTYWDVVRRPAYVCRETLRGLAITEALFANSRRKRQIGR